MTILNFRRVVKKGRIFPWTRKLVRFEADQIVSLLPVIVSGSVFGKLVASPQSVN